MPKKVLVIGAAGRVGYPFCGYAANKGYEVWGYDISRDQWNNASKYIEKDAPPLKDRAFLQSTNPAAYQKWLGEANVIVIMIGTPVDAEGNPRTDGLDAIRDNIAAGLKNRNDDVLIVLRSTVSPGTTDVFRHKLNMRLQTYGSRCKAHVVFAPERIAQGNTYVEMPKLPQLIGYKHIDECDAAMAFFEPLSPQCFTMSTRAAELGKLFTNMYRYVNFALANEFMMIADDHGVDYEQLRQGVNFQYPRMALAKAGPNSAGPCLFKDGTFLVDHIPYTELIRSSFAINEGMPAWVAKKIKEHECSEIAILGMAFKGNNDDTRYSLSFKLKKILERAGKSVVCFDPLVKEYADTRDRVKYCDAVVVMAPHDHFDDRFFEDCVRAEALVIDIWQQFNRSRQYLNGIYLNFQDES